MISNIQRDKTNIAFQIHPPVSIEKPFSKTHAPEIGIEMLEKF